MGEKNVKVKKSKLEKFKEEFDNHNAKWMTRMFIEPGYALRNVLSLPIKKECFNLIRNITIGYEIARIGVYGFTAYQIADFFIK